MHADASGRSFLANQKTGQTVWLWSKWAMQDRVFCVNAVTHERVWKDTMTPDLLRDAGLVTAEAEVQHVPVQARPTPAPTSSQQQQLHRSFRSAPTLTEKKKRPYQHSVLGDDAHAKRARVSKFSSQPTYRCPPCNIIFTSGADLSEHCGTMEHYRVVGGISNVSHDSGQGYLEPGMGMGSIENEFRSSSLGLEDNSYRNEGNGQARSSRFAAAGKSSCFRAKPQSPDCESVPSQRRLSMPAPVSRKCRSIFNIIAESGDVDPTETALVYERDLALTGSVFTNADSLDGAILGTCKVVEKGYFRLTSAAKPEEVRPESVLKRALKLVKRNWANQDRSYQWVCSQMKSIRQDLQIQHIETHLTLDVYETHARVALENGDFGEFNTCVSQLKELYGRVDRIVSVRDEFTAYRILYNVLVRASKREHAHILLSTSCEDRERPIVRYALSIRVAVSDGNFRKFFELSKHPPQRTMVSFFLDRLVDYMRSLALAAICHSFSPGRVPLSFIMRQIGWDNEAVSQGLEGDRKGSGIATSALAEALAFFAKINVVVEEECDQCYVNAKVSKAAGVEVLSGGRNGFITSAGTQ